MYKKILHYAKTGELLEFTDLTEANDFAKFSTERLMTGGGDSVRERITVDLVHGIHIDEKHGWDGKKGNLYLEVKNETIGLGKDGEKAVSGRGIFNNLTWNSFEKYETQEGLYIAAGYSRSGVLLYALAFDIKHILPILEKALEEKLPNRTDIKKINVTKSISVSDFPDEVEVIFFPDDIKRSNYSPRLLTLLNNNTSTKLRSRKLTALPDKKKISKKKSKCGSIEGVIKKKAPRVSIEDKFKALYPTKRLRINRIAKRVYLEDGTSFSYRQLSYKYSNLSAS